MSDGDNIQWVLNNFATSSEWFGSKKRGKFPMGWGISPSSVDVMPPMLSYLYERSKNISLSYRFLNVMTGKDAEEWERQWMILLGIIPPLLMGTGAAFLMKHAFTATKE